MAEVSARKFNQDVSAAKRATDQGRSSSPTAGKPSHVLLSIEDYRRLLAGECFIVHWLSAEDDIELEPERIKVERPPSVLSCCR